MHRSIVRLPSLLDSAINYILFLAYYMVSCFEHALLETTKRLSRLGLGRVLIRVIAAFAVNRKTAIQEAQKKPELQPIVVAYLNEQAGVDRRETARSIEESINALLRKAARNVEMFFAVYEFVLMLTLLGLVLPQVSTLLGAGSILMFSYLMLVMCIVLVYVFECTGLTLSRITRFPGIVWAELAVSYLAGLYTYFLLVQTGRPHIAVAIAGIVTGIVALGLTGRTYMQHLVTIRSFPARVRLSFNSLFTGASIYYPPKLDNILDDACMLIHEAARSTGSSEVVSITYRLVDSLVSTIGHMRSTLFMTGLMFLGVLIGTAITLNWMLGNMYGMITGLVPGQTQITMPDPELLKTLLVTIMLVGTFTAGKIMDNELLGTYMLAVTGIIALIL